MDAIYDKPHARSIGVDLPISRGEKRLIPFPDGTWRMFRMHTYDWQLLDAIVGKKTHLLFAFASDVYDWAATKSKRDDIPLETAIRGEFEGIVEVLQEVRIQTRKAANENLIAP